MLIKVTYADKSVRHFIVPEETLVADFSDQAGEFGVVRKVDFL